MKKRILAIFAALALLSVTAMVASAETGSVTISGGSLAVGTVPVVLTGVTLDGTDQTTTDTSNAWTAEDPTGTGAGWNLTIAATDFTSDDIQEVYTDEINGTFTLTYNGVGPSAAINEDDTAATVETVVEGLANVVDATVTGSGTSSTPWVIRFVDDSGSGILVATDTTLVSTITLATIDISVADQQFGITLVDADVAVVAGNTQPVQTSGSLQDIADSTVKFLTAPTDTGMGDYTLDPDLTLEVRAEVRPATYTSTITVSIVSGP